MDDRELGEAMAQLEADTADLRADYFAQVRTTVLGGSDAFLYRSLYVPVDSVVNDAQVADEFDVSTLQVLGLTGWQVIGVVPKTVGVGLSNSSIGTTFGTTWGGGLGGNVMGVYLLLCYRVHASNLDAAEEHMTALV
jgi:hypothetical protein